MDRYAKGVLTVIAAALVWLCVAQATPAAVAQDPRAQDGVGRFQIVAGRYPFVANSGVETDTGGVFRIDTVTGTTYYFVAGAVDKTYPKAPTHYWALVRD